MDGKRTAFVLASVMGSAMIVSRLDYKQLPNGDVETGVGRELLEFGAHEGAIAQLLCDLAHDRMLSHGPGVTVIDGGANIGSHTIALAQAMGGGTDKPWGKVLAFEVQEWTYYALCGNLAINNCFNAGAMRIALGPEDGQILVPIYDPRIERNVGGTSLIDGFEKEIRTVPVAMKAIDNMGLVRLDLIKLDVEGMEPAVLDGARKTIARTKPIMLLEWFKCGKEALAERLPDYQFFPIGIELVAIHKDDPALAKLKFVGAPA